MTGVCIFVYSATIAYLINNRTDKDRAKNALDYAIRLAKKEFCNATADEGKASAIKWIEEGVNLWAKCKAEDRYIFNPTNDTAERYKCTEAIGFIKHSFILSFYYLAKAADKDDDGSLYYDLNKPEGKNFYFESIREVISLGGDTDTNACIVGGIIGAYVGVSNITDDLLKVYFNYTQKGEFAPNKGQKRPEWLDMGRNTMDLCFWLHILRYKAKDSWEKVEFREDEPIIIKPGQEIKN